MFQGTIALAFQHRRVSMTISPILGQALTPDMDPGSSNSQMRNVRTLSLKMKEWVRTTEMKHLSLALIFFMAFSLLEPLVQNQLPVSLQHQHFPYLWRT